jgi:hypothetical protein
MITAALMIGDRLIKVVEMDEPRPYIRYHVHTSFTAMYSTSNTVVYPGDTSTTYAGSSTDIWAQVIVFELKGWTGPNTLEYQYSHVNNNKSFKVDIQERVEWGEVAPSGVLDLRRLVKKCRKRPKVRKLLLKYLRA